MRKPYLPFTQRWLFLFCGLGLVLLPVMGLTQVVATPTLTAPSFSVSEMVNSSSVQPGAGLILFSFPYTASNTTGAAIASVVPPDTQIVQVGPPGIFSGPGATVGAAAGQAVTWTITATQPVTGMAWMLVAVPNTVPLGTIINSSGEYGLSTPLNSITNAVTAVVGPNTQMDAVVSPSGAGVGSVVSYSLNWKVTGEYLSVFDSYDGTTTGAVGTSTVGSEPWGYDGTNYNIEPSGTNATWTITAGTSGDKYILAANPGASNGYLLRTSPAVQLAPQGNFSVSGAVMINAGSTNGSLALAMDSTGSNGYLVGLSTSPSPGILYVDRMTGGSPTTLSTSAMTVSTGTFYAINAAVNPTAAGGSVTLLAKAWQAFQSVPSSYAITVVDPGVITSGEMGWEIDAANTTAYTDLYLFQNNGLVNPVITDTLPTGITFQSATPAATYTAPLLNFSAGAPVTVAGGTFTYSWTGVANGCGTLNNQASINGSNIQGTPMPQVSSNIAALQVTCTSNNTPTPTPTPNGSLTPTPTPDQALYLDSNVFNPNVQPLGMEVRVDTAGEVKILIFNMAGEEVEKLVDQPMTPGNYRFSWDGRNGAGGMAGNGIYFLVIEQPSGRMIRKVVVLK